jgi:hypothetical protein
MRPVKIAIMAILLRTERGAGEEYHLKLTPLKALYSNLAQSMRRSVYSLLAEMQIVRDAG